MPKKKTSQSGFFKTLIASLRSKPDNLKERHAIEKMNNIAIGLYPSMYAQYYVDDEGYLMSDVLADDQHNRVIDEIRGVDF
jgi:hypothetical protein